jgi:rhodanese-related sulfurtransferase
LIAGKLDGALLLDVRTPEEFAAGAVSHAINVPLDELRDRLEEVPRDKPVVTYCKVGQRGYMAMRILKLAGYDVRNLSGGYTTYQQVAGAK